MTADTIAAPRSAAPRRKGPNLEKWGWIYMRASGVLLVVLIFGHLFVNLVMGEGVRGIGSDAFAEICEQAPYGVSVYARTGTRDVLVRVYHVERKGWSKASVKPTAIALARAAAGRAGGK